VNFHICVVDVVFDAVNANDDVDEGSKVKFHALADLSVDAITQVQNEASRICSIDHGAQACKNDR
jgi:hypothetical protein